MSALHHNHPEAEDRLPVATKQVWTPNDEQAEQIRRIDEWMTANNISNADLAPFCACAAETIYHIRKGTYGAKGDNMLRKIIAGTKKFTTTKARVAKLALKEFYETPEFAAFREALDTANAQAEIGDECRLVVAALPSGWGKSAWVRRTATVGDVVIHALPSWKSSYRSILLTFLAALESPSAAKDEAKRRRSVADLQDDLFAELRKARRTIFIEELSPYNVSPVLIELLRYILNETTAVIALMVVPRFLDRIRELGGETALQLFRRGEVIRAEEVTVTLARQFLSESFSGDSALSECAKSLAATASQNWGPHLCRKVTDSLTAELQANKTSLSAVVLQAKINEALRSWQAS